MMLLALNDTETILIILFSVLVAAYVGYRIWKKLNPIIEDLPETAPETADFIETMDTEIIKEMIKNYRLRQNECDTRSVQFNLSRLKEFISHIENCENIPLSDLGIRFYFAAYSSDSSSIAYPSQSADCQGRHTLIMIPTRKEDGKDKDFYVNDPNKPGFVLNADYEDILPDGVQLSAANHGSLMPPMY